jgi:hypothetical protein
MRWWLRLATRNPFVRAGLILIAVGVVCLYLSAEVVRTGWWQGTLDAFGVGFVIGGTVDAITISLLQFQVSAAADQAAERKNREKLFRELSRALVPPEAESGEPEDPEATTPYTDSTST